jgi:magnesium and cobalt transporter
MVDDHDTPENKPRSWFERLSNMLIREPKDRAQLMEVLRDAEERDILSSEILSMIESVLQVSEMQVREVMIPKAQMVVVERNKPLESLLPIVIESAHSRFPVIDEDNGDIIGILLAKDLLKYYFNRDIKDFSVNDILRPAVFVPQSKRLDILLREFRVKRNHMAIVIDEYGHVSGLVTIEDVLEQIVGDIEDEYDTDEEDDIKKHTDGNYTVKAITSIDDFNDYFNSEFSNEEFDTIGGLIAKEFGHLPKRGEIIKVENFQFKILHSDNRRIHLLEVKRIKS